MSEIQEILRLNIRPKEKQTKLVESVSKKNITADKLILFFKSASDVGKGTCADVMKHVSIESPEILVPYIDTLIEYINYKAPRVKWGISEAIGNLAKKYPEKVEKAIPNLLTNTTENKINTTVVKWCAAYALTEIAKNNPTTREQLLPIFLKITKTESNIGVKNVYAKALKIMTSIK